MPYSAIISKILTKHNVQLDVEEHIIFPYNWRVTTVNLKTMKMVTMVECGWVYGPLASSNELTLVDKDETLPPSVSRSQSTRGEAFKKSNVDEMRAMRREISALKERFVVMRRILDKVPIIVEKI